MIRADIKKYYKEKLIYKLFVYEIGLLLILGILVFLNLLQFQHMVFIVLITTIFRIVEEYLGLKVFAFKKVSLINYMGNSLFHFIWTFLGFGIYLLVLAFPVFSMFWLSLCNNIQFNGYVHSDIDCFNYHFDVCGIWDGEL